MGANPASVVKEELRCRCPFMPSTPQARVNVRKSEKPASFAISNATD
jgi:hypothetical protein